MALSGTALAAARKSALAAVTIDPVATYADRLRVADSNAIVDYLKANAVVLPGTFTNGAGAVTGTGTLS